MNSLLLSAFPLTVISTRFSPWHYSHLVLFCIAGALGVLELIRLSGITKTTWLDTTESSKLSRTDTDSTQQSRTNGFSKVWGAILSMTLIASWILGVAIALHDHSKIKSLESELAKYRAATVIEHHVAIVGQLTDGDFAYTSDEEPEGGAFRICPTDKWNGVDTEGILLQAVGYIADRAAWEERGTCKSILRADLGFWFKDKHNHFKYARRN